MEYVNLGNAGLKVSKICLGCMTFGNSAEWMLETEQSKPIINRAIDLGINFFDTANVYSKGRSEEIVGEILQGRRNDIVLATKVNGLMKEGPNNSGLSRIHIHKQIKESLKRLRTDYIDLYQIHRWDYNTPIKETLSTLNDIVHQGLVRHIGASSMYAWQFAKALWTSEENGFERFSTMQNHYNLCYREEEREMNPLCHDQDIGLIPWSPLAGGFLTGKYKRDVEPSGSRIKSLGHIMRDRWNKPETFDIIDAASSIAAEKGVTISQIALAWLLKKGVTAPIIGATKINHVEEAAESINISLSSDDIKRLEDPYKVSIIQGHQ